MSEEKEIINEHYEVISSMWLGDKRMILAVSIDKNESYPYLKCIYTENELFGSYESAIASDSYPEAIKLYADDIKAEAVQLELNQITMGEAALPCYKADEVHPVYFTDNIIGKVVAIEEKYLSVGYKDRGHQLYYVAGGSGAYPNSHGQACFSFNLYTGKKERIERYEVMGYMKEEELPKFANKTLETVKEKIRKEKDKDVR